MASLPSPGLPLTVLATSMGQPSFGGLGFGTVFELSPNGSGGWNETVLYSFTGGVDGGE